MSRHDGSEAFASAKTEPSVLSRLIRTASRAADVTSTTALLWSGMTSADDDLTALLRSNFRYAAFRPFQREAIEEIVNGRDVLLVLPTGGGKSLVYQLPPLTIPHAFTVVVSPLIALAQDQLRSCAELGICAEAWNCHNAVGEKESIEQELRDEETSLKLLYTTPESLLTNRLTDALKVSSRNGCLLSFAVDEAHCVSSYGHDFRPRYAELHKLRKAFGDVPFLAVTATCTPTVKADIINGLDLRSPKVLTASFNRPNISYQVRHKELIGPGEEALLDDLIVFNRKRSGERGIIYAWQRKTCDWLAAALEERGVDAACYHAGLTQENRDHVLQAWLEGEIHIVVATIAFGMGINKPDIRWVVHWDVAKSVEGFYQESGRAGRDGQPSVSLLYLSHQDVKKMRKLERDRREGDVDDVEKIYLGRSCRRVALLAHFGEKRGPCSDGEALCDYCRDPEETTATMAALTGRHFAKDPAPTAKPTVAPPLNKRRRGFACPRRKKRPSIP